MRLYQPTYTATDGSLRTCRTWWVEYHDEHGQRQTAPVKGIDGKTIRHRGAAEIRMGEMRESLALRKVGVNTFEAERTSPPAELVKEYLKELQRTKKTAGHVRNTSARLRAIFAGVQSLSEMTSDRIARILGSLAEAPPRSEKAVRKYERLSGRTTNFYRGCLFAFFKWLVKAERWPRNPVESVARVEEEIDDDDDPATQRRALEPEEALLLMDPATIRAAHAKEKLTAQAEYFAALYDLALHSGLRRNELKTLRWPELDLERRVVSVLAKRAKSKKRREVTLPVSTCAHIKAALGDGEGKGNGLVFAHGLPTMATFYRHLGKARVKPDTDAGHVDFHALRTTFGTNLARSGASPAEAQRQLGHSDPRLTMTFYVKLRLHDQHAVSSRLEAFMAKARDPRPHLWAHLWGLQSP